MINIDQLKEQLEQLIQKTNDELLLKWYAYTISIVNQAAEMSPDYDVDVFDKLKTTLKTLYPDVDIEDIEKLKNRTFVGALAKPADVIRKQLLEIHEKQKPISPNTLQVIYDTFNPTVIDEECIEEETKQIQQPKEPPVINVANVVSDEQLKPIDWLPNIDRTKYSIRIDGKIFNNHRGGMPVLSFMKGIERCVKLKSGKHNTSISINKLMERAFPNRVLWKNPEKRTVLVESVTKELDIKNDIVKPEEKTYPDMKQEMNQIFNDTEYVFVDWYDDIPKGKYQVFKSGRIFDVIAGKDVIASKGSGALKLSSSIGDRKKGMRQTYHHMTPGALVWKAFHPEDRHMTKVFLDYIDGDHNNVSLNNLRRSSK